MDKILFQENFYCLQSEISLVTALEVASEISLVTAIEVAASDIFLKKIQASVSTRVDHATTKQTIINNRKSHIN